MYRRTTPIAAAFAATAALLLSACGSGGGGDGDDIKGAGTQNSAKPTPSSSSAADRPKMKQAKDFTMSFEGAWTSSDPKSNAVLQDGKGRAESVNSAVLKTDPNAPEVSFYNTGSALTTAKSWVAGFQKHDLTLTGRLKYFAPKVQFKGDSAFLNYCSDESKAFSRDKKTGKANYDSSGKDNLVLYTTKLSKGQNGVWQTTAVESARGGCK
ncbi:hypothetical protein [Streptomyces sp. NPDC059009]|uniref:hypothetical protein n=1 Tax=Streptomyces sp. NPDC059009 TaxID=3346694 RepID=UPI0036783C5E